MSFHPLQRTKYGEFTFKYAGDAASDYAPSTGFCTLLTAFTSPNPPGLFHPGVAHGVLPFRAFPSRRAVTPLNARFRLNVHRLRSEPRCASAASCLRHGVDRPVHRHVLHSARGQLAFTALLPTRVRYQAAGVEAATSPMLSWAFASSGFLPLRTLANASTGLLPWASLDRSSSGPKT